MTAKRVSLDELGKEITGFAAAHVENQKQAVKRGLFRSLPMMAEKSPVDTGLYASSWNVTATEASAIIGNFAPHAPVIEYGARPFVPPIGPLLAWAKRVLQDSSQPPDYSSDVWRLARGVQNKIAREGMKPRHILQNALPDIIRNIELEFKRGGDQ